MTIYKKAITFTYLPIKPQTHSNRHIGNQYGDLVSMVFYPNQFATHQKAHHLSEKQNGKCISMPNAHKCDYARAMFVGTGFFVCNIFYVISGALAKDRLSHQNQFDVAMPRPHLEISTRWFCARPMPIKKKPISTNRKS